MFLSQMNLSESNNPSPYLSKKSNLSIIVIFVYWQNCVGNVASGKYSETLYQK